MKVGRLVLGIALLSFASCGAPLESANRSTVDMSGTTTTAEQVPAVGDCVDKNVDDCVIGSLESGVVSRLDLKVTFLDGVLITYENKGESWVKVSRQDLSQLVELDADDSGVDGIHVDLALDDVTADNSSELLLRIGPKEILTAISSRDLAVFIWKQEQMRWERLFFPAPVFKDWVHYGGDVHTRLLRWGYAKEGLVYEEVGYTDLDGHIYDKAFAYQWNGTEFKQIRIVNIAPACFTVTGDESSLCLHGIS